MADHGSAPISHQEVPMQKRFLSAFSVCAFGVLAVLVGANRASAQGQGPYITQASARLAKLVDAGNDKGYNLHNNSFSLGGGWLKQSEEWVSIYSIQLTAGKKYRFLATGDDDAKDVDLRVLNAKGDVVAKDESTAVDAVVDYSPKTTGKYKVEIRLFASKKAGGREVDCVCISAVMVK
jgi:hypothetical protein